MSGTGSSPESLPRATRRVVAALRQVGHPVEVRIVDESSHTAKQAAAALGVQTRQILKSLVFRGATDGGVVLVLLSGDRQADLARLAAELGEPVKRADPAWVRERSGFAIGGVPPIAHRTPPTVVIDVAALAESVLWAGAGTPNTLFRTSGSQLEALTGGAVADVACSRIPGPSALTAPTRDGPCSR